jgi:hypothetical protein
VLPRISSKKGTAVLYNVPHPEKILTLQEAAALRCISVDTLRRNFRDRFIRLSQRRLGIRYADAIRDYEPTA